MAEEKDLRKLIAKLAEARKGLQDLSKSFDAVGLLAKQTAALKKNTAAKQDQEDQDKDFEDTARDVAVATAELVTNVAGAAQKMRESRDDFTSLDPALKMAGTAVGALGSGAGKTVSAIGDVVSAASWFATPLGKVIGTGVGMGLNALGDFMDKNSKQIAQIGVQYGQFATGEMNRVFTAFRDIGSVGALGAEGISALYSDAIKASVDVGAYSKIIKSGSQNFAMLGGTTEKGVKLYSQVNEQTKDLKDKYLALGMSYEETADMQAKGIERARMMGSVDANNVNSLVAASSEYIDQLNEISRLTGMSRQQANAVMEKQMASVRFQAALQDQVAKDGNKDIADRMSNVSAYFTGKGGDTLGTAIMESMSGVATDAGQKLSYMTGGQSQILAEQLKAGKITEQQYIMGIEDALRTKMQDFDPETLAKNMGTNKTLIGLDQYFMEARKLTTGAKLTAEDLEGNKAAVEKNAQANDETTKNVVDAQKALRDVSLSFDKIVKDKVFPNASSTIAKFADTMDEFVSKATGKESTRAQRKAAQHSATGGGTPDTGTPVDPNGALTGKSLSGVNGALASGLTKAAMEYKSMTGKPVVVTSAVRTPEEQQKLYNDYISGKSKYPAAAPGKSKHDSGMAVDIDSGIANQLDSMGLLAKNGLGRPVRGDPVHIEVVSAATGGAFSGPKTGFPAVLHGTEAVVPLPNGRSIPVQMTGNIDPASAQKAQILVEQNAIIDQMIFYAKQSHSSGKKLVAYKNN